MSEFLHDDQDQAKPDSYDVGDLRYDDDAASRRRRGLWGLLVLALVSVTIVAVFSFLLGTSGAGHRSVQAGPLPNDGPAVSVLPSSSPTPHPHRAAHRHHRARSSASATHRPTPSRSTTPSASASASSSAAEVATVPTPSAISTRPTPRPHRTSGPCASTQPCAVGGFGGADSAINAYRSRQGQQPIQISSSPAATQCAMTNGAQGCTSPFAVVPVSRQNGAEAVREIVASGGDWLGGSMAGGVSIGWAYLPAEHTYICAVVTG